MPDLLIIFIIFVFSLALTIAGIGEIMWHRVDVDIDSQYLDEDGDHVYYERSLIEKKEFIRRHPNIKGIRSFFCDYLER